MHKQLALARRFWAWLLIGIAGSGAAVFGEDEAPQQGPELRRMQPFVGGWRTDETFHPVPWAPEGNVGKGYMTARWTLNGTFLNIEYHSTGRTGPYAGASMFTYDEQKQAYRMWWFDSRGGAQEFSGRWDEATRSFVLQVKGSDRQGTPVEKRMIYRFVNDTTIKFSLEYGYKDKPFQPYIESTYTRTN